MFCECGCGKKTTPASKTHKRFGHIKGQALRFILGHSGRHNFPPFKERFWQKVKKSDGCWEWIGGCNARGYGQICLEGRSISAPRASWIIHHGPILDGLHILHKCDNPSCVRPDHLFIGDHAANMADRNAKGRVSHGEKHYCAKLNPTSVIQIRTLLADRISQRKIAISFSVSQSTIGRVKRGVSWRDA